MISLFLHFIERYIDCTGAARYDKMLEKANLDVVIVETGADIHAAFVLKH